MKVSEELVQHIYTKLWSVNRSVIEDAFESFEGKVFELNVEETKPLTAEHDPSYIEERVKALEDKVNYLTELHQDTVCIEPTKQNISIDTPTIDWKKVECLSYEDVIEAIQDNWGLKLGDALEIYIKNKLKK